MGGVREDAEDALSRAMLRALDKLQHIGPRIENIRAWLTRLTVNLCADVHRERKRRTRRLEHIDDVLPSLGEGLPADIDSPEDALLIRETYVCVCDAVNDLPDRLREPFALRFFQEMAYIDIAERLILTNQNVRKRIQQARAILKQRLHDRFPCGRCLAGSHRAAVMTMLPLRLVINAGPCEDVVARCLASVRAQRYRAWTATVTIDPAGDRTFERAVDAVDGDPRLSIVRNPRRRYAWPT